MPGPFDIRSDGTTVWVDGLDGSLGRFGPRGSDVHRTGAEQAAGLGHCLACSTTPDWIEFIKAMREHHGCVISGLHEPAWSRESRMEEDFPSMFDLEPCSKPSFQLSIPEGAPGYIVWLVEEFLAAHPRLAEFEYAHGMCVDITGRFQDFVEWRNRVAHPVDGSVIDGDGEGAVIEFRVVDGWAHDSGVWKWCFMREEIVFSMAHSLYFDNGYGGHQIAWIDGWFIDLTARQYGQHFPLPFMWHEKWSWFDVMYSLHDLEVISFLGRHLSAEGCAKIWQTASALGIRCSPHTLSSTGSPWDGEVLHGARLPMGEHERKECDWWHEIGHFLVAPLEGRRLVGWGQGDVYDGSPGGPVLADLAEEPHASLMGIWLHQFIGGERDAAKEHAWVHEWSDARDSSVCEWELVWQDQFLIPSGSVEAIGFPAEIMIRIHSRLREAGLGSPWTEDQISRLI